MKYFVYLMLLLSVIFAGCSMDQGKKIQELQAADSLVLENIFPLQLQHCHGSSIVELPNKDLIVAWFQGSFERTADDVKIMGSRYDRTSHRRDEPFIMADVPGFPDINPVLFTDNRSRLWLVWYTVMAYQWESSLLKYRISNNYMQKSGPPQWIWQDMIHVKPGESIPDGIGKNDSFMKTLTRKYDDYYSYLVSAGYIKTGDDGVISREMWENALTRYLNIARGTNLISNGIDIDENGEKVRTQLGYPLMRRIGWQSRNKPLRMGEQNTSASLFRRI